MNIYVTVPIVGDPYTVEAFDCAMNEMVTAEVAPGLIRAKKIDGEQKWAIYSCLSSSKEEALVFLEGEQSGLHLYSAVKLLASTKAKPGRYRVNLLTGEITPPKAKGFALNFELTKGKFVGAAIGIAAFAVIFGVVNWHGENNSAELNVAGAKDQRHVSPMGVNSPVQISEQGKLDGITGSDAEKLKVAQFLASMTKPEFEAYIEGKSTGDPVADIQNYTYLASLRATGVAINEAAGNKALTPASGNENAALISQISAIALSPPGKQAGISVFADPQCPACQHYEKILEDELADRAITIYPVAILEGSDYIIDQIMCSANPAQAWMYYMKNQKLLSEVAIDGCSAAFAHEKNLEVFEAAGLSQTPSSIFESVPLKAAVGSVIPDQFEQEQLAKK